MPKKGVFGNKEMPLDSIRGTMPPVTHHHQEPKEATIKKAHGGYLVHTRPGKKGDFHDEHVASSMDDAIGIMSKHMGDSKDSGQQDAENC